MMMMMMMMMIFSYVGKEKPLFKLLSNGTADLHS
jgi:hypothetical protein